MQSLSNELVNSVTTRSNIPPEIYLLIFKLATLVPEACDTSFESIHAEDTEIVLQAIHESMLIKTRLSLVSKAFNSLMETLMYEIIVITDFRFIPVLLYQLQSTPIDYSAPRGSFCRRLDIYLGITLDAEYSDEAWYEGGHTLWGLLPACPHLEVLIAQVHQKDRGHLKLGLVPPVPPQLTHNALWKTIATYCSPTLRRLEIFGFHIRMDRVEMMLRSMTSLEVCRIFHCRPFKLYDFTGSHRTGKWHPDTYDDEEPSSRKSLVTIPSAKWSRTMSWVTVVQSRSLMKTSGLFEAKTVKNFQEALENTRWPHTTSDSCSSLIVLPSLHTLYFELLTEQFFNFSLPVLRSLGIFRVEVPAVFVSRKSATFVLGHPTWPKARSGISGGNVVYKTQTFPPPPPHSTLFGCFPDTITHVHLQDSNFHPEQIRSFFPCLTHLSWSVTKILAEDVVFPSTLQTITLFLQADASSTFSVVCGSNVHHIMKAILLKAVKTSKLVALRKIHIRWIIWDGFKPSILAFEEFDPLGVQVTSHVVEASRVTYRRL
ncbi:hypothetical protein H0H92_009366 [Tricholoma furcatifolium]|nr:hypothetical protein H0H92_009366 [Tricholoma furcatifolium]